MEKDMTKGSPMKLILGFAVPLLFGLVFQQFYSMMDAVIVGHYLGVDALAAVGATGSVNFLIIGFCMGVCNGFAIPIAQEFGAKHESELKRFVANSVWLSVIFAVVITIVVSLLCRQILQLMRTPGEYHRWLLQLHNYYFPWHTGGVSLQYDGGDPALPRGQQNACGVPCDSGDFEYFS